MKSYELTYLISLELKQEEINNLLSKIESVLQEEGGTITENKKERIVQLGYKIKKQSKAFLAVLKFKMEPDKIKTFKEKIGEIPQVLKFLLLSEKPTKIKKEIPRRIKKLPKEEKVELKGIEEKLEELLGE